MMRIYVLVLILSAVLIQCSPVKLSLSREDMDNLSEYDVKGRNGLLIKQQLSFGNYYTSTVNRSWTKGDDLSVGVSRETAAGSAYLNIISLDYINRKQTIHFKLTDDSNHESEVYCVSKFKARDLILGDPSQLASIGIDLVGTSGNDDQHMYYAQVYTPKSQQPWQLVVNNRLAQERAKTYKGILSKNDTAYYTIVPVTALTDKNGKTSNLIAGSMGYEFRNKAGVAVAAVSLVDNGKIYLDNLISTEERFVLANACAALLLQEVIEA